MAINNLHAFVVDFQVFVYVSACVVVEKELGASYFTHGCSLAGVLYFCKKHWSCRAVLIVLKVSSVFCAEAEISSSPEGGDYAYVFVFVAPKPGCVFFAFNCAILSKRI